MTQEIMSLTEFKEYLADLGSNARKADVYSVQEIKDAYHAEEEFTHETVTREFVIMLLDSLQDLGLNDLRILETLPVERVSEIAERMNIKRVVKHCIPHLSEN